MFIIIMGARGIFSRGRQKPRRLTKMTYFSTNEIFLRFLFDAEGASENLMLFCTETAYDVIIFNHGQLHIIFATFVLFLFCRLSFVKTVCETGFNAGHSSLLWLLANPNVKVYSFDLNRYECTEPMANYMKNRFPDRFTITFGDSTETLPKFRREHPDIKCDMMIIDGGHTVEVASADFENFYQMSNKKNIVFYDNHPDLYDLRQSWEVLKLRGKLYQYFRCQYLGLKGHGFTFGRFFFLIEVIVFA